MTCELNKNFMNSAADHWGRLNDEPRRATALAENISSSTSPPRGRYRLIYFITNYATPVAALPCSTACRPLLFKGAACDEERFGPRCCRRRPPRLHELAPRDRGGRVRERRRRASVAICRHAKCVNCKHKRGLCRHWMKKKTDGEQK